MAPPRLLLTKHDSTLRCTCTFYANLLTTSTVHLPYLRCAQRHVSHLSPAKSESPLISMDIPNGVFRSYAGSQRPYSAASTFPLSNARQTCFSALSCVLKRVNWRHSVSVRHVAVQNTVAGFHRLFLIRRFAFLQHTIPPV